MSLRVRRRPDTGVLEITGTVRPAGAAKGVRIRRRAGADEPALAREEAAALEASVLRAAWHGERPAVHGFADAIVSYLKHEPRTSRTTALVRRLLLHFRDAPLASITQDAVDGGRDVLLRPGPSAGTVRRNLIVPLRAILLHANRRGWCERPAFDLPRERRGRTAFLLPAQAEALTDAASPHHRPLLRFLICTGCRMSEALTLGWDQVDLTAGRAILWEGETKSGDRRIVDLPPMAVAALAELRHRIGPVFVTARGKPYRDSGQGGGQLRTAWATACRRAGLPGTGGERARSDRASKAITFRPVHTPHDLRHTWASWHYALHRDLLRLKRDGGWSSVALVERYAHLMPVGREDAIQRAWGMRHDTDTPAVPIAREAQRNGGFRWFRLPLTKGVLYH